MSEMPTLWLNRLNGDTGRGLNPPPGDGWVRLVPADEIQEEPWPTEPCPEPGDEAEDHEACQTCFGTRSVYVAPAAPPSNDPEDDDADAYNDAIVADKRFRKYGEQIEYGRQFPDGEVIPSPAGYVDDPRWLTCAGQPVAWVQRTVTYSDWTPKDQPAAPAHAFKPRADDYAVCAICGRTVVVWCDGYASDFEAKRERGALWVLDDPAIPGHREETER